MHYNQSMEHRLARRLKESLGPGEWELLQRVAEAAQELRVPLYVVGGAPRDLLLGQPIGDLDLVVEGDAQALARLLRREHGGKLTLHGKFGTAKWEPPQAERAAQPVDLITARSETYKHPAALPTVQAGTIEDDLRRRDFTINALAIRLDAPHTGAVRDDFGGWEDIQAGIMRVLHEGSFVDDPTRMYRAVRYEQRYGFRVASETEALIPAARPIVAKLSAQRIRHELDLMLDERAASTMLARLDDLNLLNVIHPALSFDGEARRRIMAVEAGTSLVVPEWTMLELRWLAWLMGLSQEEIEGIEHRLHFHGALHRALVAASELWREAGTLISAAPSGWVERLDGVPLAAVYAVYVASLEGAVREALGQYLRAWRYIKPKTTGHDLKQLGLEPGAQYKSILGELRRAWLDGKIRSNREEQEYLRRLVAESAEK